MRKMIPQKQQQWIKDMKDHIAQDGNTTEVGGNLYVDGTIEADKLTDGTTTKTITEVLAGGSAQITRQDIVNATGLVSPLEIPTAPELVGVGTAGEQVRIELGANLTLSGLTSPYTLNATGGNSKHCYLLTGDVNVLMFSDEEFTTKSDITSWLQTNGYTSQSNVYKNVFIESYAYTQGNQISILKQGNNFGLWYGNESGQTNIYAWLSSGIKIILDFDNKSISSTIASGRVSVSAYSIIKLF